MTSLPIGKRFSPTELGELFVAVEDAPYGNESLAYRVMIPKGWNADSLQAETAELNTVQLKPLGIFSGFPMAGSRAYIQIQAVRLPKCISAINWLRYYAQLTNRTIEEAVVLSPVFADTLVNFSIDGHRFKGRAAARIDRNRLFLILAFSSIDAYDDLMDFFGIAVSSFALLSGDPQATIEQYVSFSGPAALVFSYPKSWVLAEAVRTPPGKQAVDLRNLDDDKVLNGLIRLKSVSKTLEKVDSESVIHDIKDEFKDAGLVIGNKINSADVPIEGGTYYGGHNEAFAGTFQGQSAGQELWVTIFEDANFYYAAVLLTPDKESAFLPWAINFRAYEIILESLH